MKTIAYIIPYFGKLPEMFDLWLKSCALNPTIDWLLFTNDKTEHQYPNNVKVTYMTFTELVSKIQSKFPFKILVPSPYRLCDYKVAYGHIFEEELNKNKEYVINLFELKEISSITIDTLAQYDNEKEFNDEESIEEIYEVFADKKTHIESVNDIPVNPDILYFVKFKNDSGNYKSAYIYKKDNQYYIEQPYNGIYQVTEDEYTRIEKVVK